MKIGIPKEIKNHEYRVALTDQGVSELLHHGHEVYVEKDAGIHLALTNEHYERLGATIKATKQALYEISDVIVKVKEPQLAETQFMHENQIIFSYLHLAVEKEMTEHLLAKRVLGIAFETITSEGNFLPLLFPMSEIAGKLSIQEGAFYLKKSQSGRGVLLGGAVGTHRARVVVLGGGTSGTAAAKIALGMGAHVVIFDKSLARMRVLHDILTGSYQVLYPSQDALETETRRADLLVGSVLLPGGKAPKLVSREMVAAMQPGSVIVDIAIDQGGCIATSKPTTHSAPTFVDEDVIHYCVTNMPASVPLTASRALENSILPYLLKLVGHKTDAASEGDSIKRVYKTLRNDPHLLNGLNVCNGNVTHQAVAEALSKKWVNPLDLF
ncbi:alanine dehydrogenase [Spirochaetota bacterium]|nr:alanine dehydrogenase [Spirochaetota bacterium]